MQEIENQILKIKWEVLDHNKLSNKSVRIVLSHKQGHSNEVTCELEVRYFFELYDQLYKQVVFDEAILNMDNEHYSLSENNVIKLIGSWEEYA